MNGDVYGSRILIATPTSLSHVRCLDHVFVNHMIKPCAYLIYHVPMPYIYSMYVYRYSIIILGSNSFLYKNEKPRYKYLEKEMCLVTILFLFSVSFLMHCSAWPADQGLVHEHWVPIARALDGEVELMLAIRQTNVEWLERKLRAVSYPNSPDYGNYLNFDEIARVVYGRPDSVEAILATFASAGVNPGKIDFTLGRDFAVITAPLKTVEELFSAEFYLYQHVQDPEWTVVKSLRHTIPQSLASHLDFVSGISNFPRPNRVTPKKQETPSTFSNIPTSLWKDYNISYVCSNPQSSQAVAAFLKVYFSPHDLSKFQEMFGIASNPIFRVEGLNNENDPGLEGSLDVQYITAMGRNAKTWFISISTTANRGHEDFLSYIMEVVNDTGSPWVHSVSYGDYEVSIPTDYQTRAENEFMKFGISGRSLMIASGDDGIHCEKNKYGPMWPTCSPYVTSVGGTKNMNGVWSNGGGGFSNTFAIPDYQKSVVEAYLASGKAPPTKYFNTSGRAYPDVSVLAVNFEIIYDGHETAGSGTSCASPTFAGIVTCLNDVRLNSGKKTLGFLNPLLYQTLQGKGFFDITEGSNPGLSSCPGFKAIEHWDPASGWGSPNFGILRELLANI